MKKIIEMICAERKMTENEAIKSFYESHTGKCFSDDETGLYGQSALFIFSQYSNERES